MLTSKEIIERTGISRATLNNYIASGLVPRPQVLPPGPEHGAAPRIGYFPDDTIARVETIQRLKREGWSMGRISDHFAGGRAGDAPSAATGAGPVAAPPSQLPVPPALPPTDTSSVTSPVMAAAAMPAPARALPAAPALPPADGLVRVSLTDARYPAWLVNENFRIVWSNQQARTGDLSPLAHRVGLAGASVFQHLLAVEQARGRGPLLQLHLEAAKARTADAANLFAGLPQEQAAALEALYREADVPAGGLVLQARLETEADLPARVLYAVQFGEGVLFAVAPVADEVPAAATAQPVPASPPTVTPVAVLAGRLQDAAGLWVKLTAQEYFELLNEVGGELDQIFRGQYGSPGRSAGEVLACYFLPHQQGSYLWSALAAAQQTRDAMRQVSHRWQLRKGWDVELCLNIGLDEGQEWLGRIGPDGDLRVLGDAADRADQLSQCSRMGAILVTRGLLGKLSADERQRLTYAVPRLDGSGAEGRLLFTFARLEEVAAPAAVPARFADVAVAELLDLNSPHPFPAPRGAG